MSKKQEIIDEIRNKIEDYETNMSSFLTDFNDWADMFTVKKPARKSNAYSNPRVTEMQRAVSTLATMEYRMLTAQDPFFSVIPMDILAGEGDYYRIEKTIETQLKISKYRPNLLKALYTKILSGTVIVEESFKWITLNAFGRRIPVTTFNPRSFLQIGFDRNTTDINEADWIYTTDLITKSRLRGLARDDVDSKAWNKPEIEEAIAGSGEDTTNPFIINRLNNAGYTPGHSKDAMELVMFHGRLDTMNDGIEYACGLINRAHLVRFRSNPDQSGKRDFRVAKWIDWDIEPLGLGLGKLFGKLHKSLDNNRQRVQDGAAFSTYPMWMMNNAAGINTSDFKITPFRLIPTSDTNALRPVEISPQGLINGLKLEEILKSEFRAATGATDTLQAIITEATAAEVSLAQNEAVRAISVKAELAAESLVREHIEQMHKNNSMNINEQFVISGDNGPQIIYPNDMKIDIDIEVKVTTDKDFKPQRMKDMLQAVQVLTSIRNEHPDKQLISTIPLWKEIARMLGINPAELIQQLDLGVLPVGGTMNTASQPEIPATTPDSFNMIRTNVGDVMGSQNEQTQ